MIVYDNKNLNSLLKEYYGENSKQYQEIICAINKHTTSFCSSEINDYFKEIEKHPRLSALEQQKCIEKCINGDKNAKQILINSKLHYVFLVALGYIGNGANFEDLIQEGNIGLIKAVNSLNDYNKNKFGFQVNVYVNQYINNYLKKYCDNVNKKMTSSQISKIIDYYRDEILCNSNMNYICDELDKNQENSTTSNNISLHLLEDVICSDTNNPENIVINQEHNLWRIINNSNLTDTQKQYLIIRLGLLDNKIKSKRETSKILNVSPNAVNCTHKFAIKKLKLNKELIELYYSYYHNDNEYKKLINENKKYELRLREKRHFDNKKRWIYIKKFIYQFFPSFAKSQIDNALSSLTKDETKVLENIVNNGNDNLKQEFFNILDKLSKILKDTKYNDYSRKENIFTKYHNICNMSDDLKYAKEKINIVCENIKKLSILNELKINQKYMKKYNIKIFYNKCDNYYKYTIRITEKTTDNVNIFSNINFNLPNNEDGMTLIIDMIKNINENSTNISIFDQDENFNIINNSNIEISISTKNIVEKHRLKKLNQYFQKKTTENILKLKK